MTETIETRQLRVVFFRDEGAWIAHGVDLDVAAHGASLAEAQQAFGWALVGEIIANVERRREPLAGIPKAPEHICRLFDEADAQLRERSFELPPGVSIPAPFMLPRVVEDGRVVSRLN